MGVCGKKVSIEVVVCLGIYYTIIQLEVVVFFPSKSGAFVSSRNFYQGSLCVEFTIWSFCNLFKWYCSKNDIVPPTDQIQNMHNLLI